MKKRPTVSVIMPTYNTPVEMLSEAVNSILEQTFMDFEFIIIDDCSTDTSVQYLETIQDERVKIIRNQQNMGITKSLNIGLSLARGRYIARMDSDDISLPERFEKQLAFMEANPDVIVCGTWVQTFGDATYAIKRVIPEQEQLRCSFLFGNVYGLCHPTAFFRGETLRQHNITYDENLPTAQDYGMWTVCTKYGQIANVEEVLLHYRVHNGQISAKKRQLQMQCTLHVQTAILRRAMPQVTPAQAQMHVKLCRERKPSRKLVAWVRLLEKSNRATSAYKPEVFTQVAEDYLKQKFTDFAHVARTPDDILGAVLFCPKAARSTVFKTLLARIKRTKKSCREL